MHKVLKNAVVITPNDGGISNTNNAFEDDDDNDDNGNLIVVKDRVDDGGNALPQTSVTSWV